MNDNDNPKNSNDGHKEKQKFDWITQRYACSLPNVFKDLRLQIEQDVKTRNSLRPNNAPYEFSIADNDDGFRVVLKAKELEMAVRFVLTEHAMVVRDDKGVEMFEVTLTFNDLGECQLSVSGEPHDYWQVRRMALEELMFRGN
ncbi:MAG TPA: hypothetical protein VFF50_08175 [Candidatus Deferrimicrobiaceae bacterium]|nr:hypothetical protein [Candidatus Deferrimicrobiaceae bacterium]